MNVLNLSGLRSLPCRLRLAAKGSNSRGKSGKSFASSHGGTVDDIIPA